MISNRGQDSSASGFNSPHALELNIRTIEDIEHHNMVTKEKQPGIHPVSWNGPSDPENPLNWSRHKKWTMTGIVASFTFVSSSSSSMLAPAIPAISRDIGATTEIEQQLIFSAFVIAYLIGPMFLAPLSETFGRSIILHIAAWFYLVWSIGSGFVRTPVQMITFRVLAGLGASAPIAIGGGVLSDIWAPDERSKAMSIYSIMPMLGPSLGPLASGPILQFSNWRWIFWAKSIFDAAIQILALSLLRETYAPLILQRKAMKRQNKTTYRRGDRSVSTLLKTSLVRPFSLLGREPKIQILSIYLAFLFGVQYLNLSTFTILWTVRYKQSVSIAGLHYISLSLGFIIGGQCCAVFDNKISSRMRKDESEVEPEHRLLIMIPGALLVAIGLVWYGWSAQVHLHWMMPDIGIFIFAFGCSLGVQNTQLYIIDAYRHHAASALAASNVLRFIAGFTLPLLAPSLFKRLDYGWGNTLLGFLALVFGFLGPLVLWVYRRTLRTGY